MDIRIRNLESVDLADADRIFRLAFGTFLGLPHPTAFGGDADYVHSRWRAAPAATLGAFVDGELVGSNFVTRRGSFGFFGPLTVHPDFWGRGIAQRLLEQTMPLFTSHGVTQAALFTFPQSTQHVALYQKFGFWPGHLTLLLEKVVPAAVLPAEGSLLAREPGPKRERAIAACRELTASTYPGLDVTDEIDAVATQRLGETVLIAEDDGELAGFAVCHLGPGSEAGSGAAYLKFAIARPGPGAEARLERVLAAGEALAAARGLGRVVAGVNTARRAACRILLARGYRSMLQGVAMQRGADAGYDRPDCFVLDDLR
jgi:GNAT superfamily N-acetyltransferase